MQRGSVSQSKYGRWGGESKDTDDEGKWKIQKTVNNSGAEIFKT